MKIFNKQPDTLYGHKYIPLILKKVRLKVFQINALMIIFGLRFAGGQGVLHIVFPRWYSSLSIGTLSKQIRIVCGGKGNVSEEMKNAYKILWENVK